MPRTFRHDSDHLRVFLTIYAVFFTVGLIRVVEAICDQPDLTRVLAGLCLALIGLRLIFSPEALSQYLLCCHEHQRSANPRAVTLWHYPVLLGQASIIYFASYQLKNSGADLTVAWSAIAAVGTNIGWLTWQVVHAKRANVPLDELGGSHLFWISNNAIFVVLASGALLVSSTYTIFVLGVSLVNSLVDLWITAKWYVPQVRDEPANVKAA